VDPVQDGRKLHDFPPSLTICDEHGAVASGDWQCDVTIFRR
jgi:hypothetical protein